MTEPAVSVLIAVHNGLPYLEQAVRSMMDQTLRDIEIVIVDDASTDATPEILARLAAEDPRIRVETLSTNRKLPGALNRGLELVRAPLVARMDADDISHPERLERQKTYLDRHPEVVLAGASIRQIDGNGRVFRTSRRGRDAVATRWLARFHMPLVHPTFMFRRQPGHGASLRYDPDLAVSQDYDFVARVLSTGEAVSLPDVLLDYRVHGTSITGTKWKMQMDVAAGIAARVQAVDLPATMREMLAPVNTAFLRGDAVPPADIFAALEAMLDHDRREAPAYRGWMRRQAAQLAMRSLQRSGQGSRGEIVRAFRGPGRRFALPLAFRAAEIKGLLPDGSSAKSAWA